MTSSGPSDELQEVEEELEKKKGEGEEADDEPASSDVESGKENKKLKGRKGFVKSFGAENLKIFTQVIFFHHFTNITFHLIHYPLLGIYSYFSC